MHCLYVRQKRKCSKHNLLMASQLFTILIQAKVSALEITKDQCMKTPAQLTGQTHNSYSQINLKNMKVKHTSIISSFSGYARSPGAALYWRISVRMKMYVLYTNLSWTSISICWHMVSKAPSSWAASNMENARVNSD